MRSGMLFVDPIPLEIEDLYNQIFAAIDKILIARQANNID
jgi:hypothetical protein